MEVVAGGAVECQRDAVESQMQRLLHARRQLRGLCEESTGGALTLGARIMHIARTGAEAPLAAPEIADNGTHRATVAVVDSISLFCHDDND